VNIITTRQGNNTRKLNQLNLKPNAKKSILRNYFKCTKFKIQIHSKCIQNILQITNTTKVFRIHCKILNKYLKYYLKYMYFKIVPITG